MNKFELNDFINQFVGMIEEGGSKLKSEAENLGQNFKTKREIIRLETSIRDDYVNVGLLVYELSKMGKDFKIEDFKDKFNSIEEKKRRLKELEREEEFYKDSKDEDIFNRNEEKEESEVKTETEKEEDSPDDHHVICPNCGHVNTKFVAYCSNCGKEL